MTLRNTLLPLTLAGVMIAGSASAFEAVTTEPSNLRAGPSAETAVLTGLNAQTALEVNGCLDTRDWCEVKTGGQMGWLRGTEIAVKSGDAIIPLSVGPKDLTVKTVTYIDKAEHEEHEGATAAGMTAGAAVAATAVGGPAAMIAGAIIGGSLGAAASVPDEQVVTYVEAHPVDPIYLEGEVTAGAILPETVTLVPVPDTTYAYLNVNDRPVLVEPETRQILYVVN